MSQAPPAFPPTPRRKWPWVLGGAVALLIVLGLVNGGNSNNRDVGSTAATSTDATSEAQPLATEAPLATAALLPPVAAPARTPRRTTVPAPPAVKYQQPPPVIVLPTLRAQELPVYVAPPVQATPAAVRTTAPPVGSIGPGTHVVGTDIAGGTYRTAGPSASDIPNCYFARLKDTSGTLSSIIINGNPQGPTTIIISSTDGAFETSGCQPWIKT